MTSHYSQFTVASTTETTETLVGRADVECHVMREDTIVEQATAKEIIHEDVGTVRRFGAEFRRDESCVFELPLSDVAVVDGETAVLDCRVAATPRRHEVTSYVEIRQTDGYQIRRRHFRFLSAQDI